MWEKIVDILKALLEKHFIPSLCAIPLTALVFYILPSNNSILLKLGTNFFLISLYISFFLLIKFSIYIYNFVKKYLKMIIERKKLDEKNIKDIVDEWLEKMDQLSPANFDIIDYLVDNNNKPLTVYEGLLTNDYDLRDFVDFRKYKVKEEKLISVDPFDFNSNLAYKKDMLVSQFKLKDYVYSTLKYIKKKNNNKLTKF